ncbi:LysR substrate-binding domain-containing protein [Beijerinckia indica]|uniref:LysR substrate-binding domain-containing protein n=1 Tax=Beijerinckia indica TaxID=533 RepID=UPI001930E1B3|nr:LysR substrate-binding domain-containing protein [Beijerinckia indica]
MELPSIKGLQALAALKKADSLSHAAVLLGATRSALSHRIAELERQLGVTLIRQAGRRAVLTDDAQALLLVMGDALDRIEAAIEPLRRRRQQLRISTVATFASHWLLPRLPDWQTRHPHIDLLISTSTRPVDLTAEDFDCALRHGLGKWEGLASTLLFRETLVPVGRPDVSDISKASMLIRARSRFRDWLRWWRACGLPGNPPTRGVIVETRAQAMDAVLAGAGITMMDEAYIKPYVAAGRLRTLGETIFLAEGYYLVVPDARRQPSEAVKLFKAWLLDQAAAH